MEKYRYKNEWKLLFLSSVIGIIILAIAVILSCKIELFNVEEIESILILIAFPSLIIVFHIYATKVVEKEFMEVHSAQFPDIYQYLEEASIAYGIPLPKAYVSLTSAINPCRDDFGLCPYVLIGSDYYAGCRENDTPEALKFMVYHQVAHIALYHGSAWWYIFGAVALNVPILKAFLSHSQEYSADAAAASICPEGAFHAIQLSTVGKDNYVYGNPVVQIEKGLEKKTMTDSLIYRLSPYPSYILRIRNLVESGLVEEAELAKTKVKQT